MRYLCRLVTPRAALLSTRSLGPEVRARRRRQASSSLGLNSTRNIPPSPMLDWRLHVILTATANLKKNNKSCGLDHINKKFTTLSPTHGRPVIKTCWPYFHRGGKTVTFSHIVKEEQGSSIVLAHQAELVAQMSLALHANNYGIE